MKGDMEIATEIADQSYRKGYIEGLIVATKMWAVCLSPTL